MANGFVKNWRKSSFIFSNVQDPSEEIKLVIDDRDANQLFHKLTYATQFSNILNVLKSRKQENMYRLLSIVEDIGWIKELVEDNFEHIEGLEAQAEQWEPARIPVKREAVFIKPRTNETKKFLSNLKEIAGLRFEHKWTTVRIGKQFGIRPQQLRYMLRYYLGGAIE